MNEYKILHIKHGKILTVETFYDYEDFEEMLWLASDIKSPDVTIAVIITTSNR